jgi:glycerophosphoryl diester phosphodiesterase
MKNYVRIILRGIILAFSVLSLCCYRLNEDAFEYKYSITVSSPSPDSIYISWENMTTIESYQIFRRSNDTEEFEYLVAIYNSNSYLDTGLQPATRYSYKIAYIDSNNTEQFMGDSFFAVTQPHLIAHRGFWGIDGSVENSIRSLQAAAELGVYGSEFDVYLTADNVPVVYHNYAIDGTDIYIQYVPYNTMEDIVLSNGERFPTLYDYLEAGKILSIQLILEIKPHATPERNREAAQIVVDRVKYFGLEDRVDYITFSLEIGRELIRLQPESNVGYLNVDLTPSELKEYGFSTLSYYFGLFQSQPEYINEAKDLGLITAVWTVNDLSIMESLTSQGVNFITTDIPLQAKNYFEQKLYQYFFYE